jgi:hypothetical protein
VDWRHKLDEFFAKDNLLFEFGCAFIRDRDPLLNHGDPDALQEQLLPELLRVSGELKSWQTRREATRE